MAKNIWPDEQKPHQAKIGDKVAKQAAVQSLHKINLEPAIKNCMNLLEEILSRTDLNEVYEWVKKKKGTAGIDGMEVRDMLGWLKINRENFLDR